MVQQVALETGPFVYMVLGMEDDIKSNPCSLIYGQDLTTFLQWTGLSQNDVWPPEDDNNSNNDKSLWHAKIHPVCSGANADDDSFPSLFQWLNSMKQQQEQKGSSETMDEESSLSLERWKATRTHSSFGE
jgi:hypothetical protein